MEKKEQKKEQERQRKDTHDNLESNKERMCHANSFVLRTHST